MDTGKGPSEVRTRALNNAYALLRQRPRSEFEIRNRLKLKGYGDEVIESVVDSLKRSHQLDDANFAKLWIDSRMHANPMGDVVLRHELKEKGVAESVIDAALARKDEEYDEVAVAMEMARDRFERLKKIEPKKALKRVYDFLIRRGFKYDTVRKVVEVIASGAKQS